MRYASDCTRKTLNASQAGQKYSPHQNSVFSRVGHWPVNGLCTCVARTNLSGINMANGIECVLLTFWM